MHPTGTWNNGHWRTQQSWRTGLLCTCGVNGRVSVSFHPPIKYSYPCTWDSLQALQLATFHLSETIKWPRGTAYSTDTPVVSTPESHLVRHEHGEPTCSKIGIPLGWNTTRVFTVPGNRTCPTEASGGPQSRHQYLLPSSPTCWALGATATISNDLSRLSPAHIF